MKRLIAIRRQQPAFHPNATQFTMHLGDGIFAFWRQSIDRGQSIFALNNVTAGDQEVLLTDINLIATDQWLDLISGERISEQQAAIVLKPYQSIWLTNRI